MSFPCFSNVSNYATTTIKRRINNPIETSTLNCYIKLCSGVEPNGCVLYSNPKAELFTAAGDDGAKTIYGDKERSGIIGIDWNGKAITSGDVGGPGKPSPIVTSLEIDEGAGELSRKAKFTIRCFSIPQLNKIMEYYMEPGFSVFIQFGWNTVNGLKGNIAPSAGGISKFMSISELEGYRASASGEADVYLGFITGGDVSISDNYWDVNVKLCGFTELPAYLMAADNPSDKNKDVKVESIDYPTGAWWQTENIKQKRWPLVFNSLPSNKKTKLVKSLEQAVRVNNPINFVNFDPKVAEEINTKKDSSWFSRIFGEDDDIKVVDSEGNEKEIDVGNIKLIGEERFIRFETLMLIINRIPSTGIKVNNKYIPYKINTDRTICTAFENMFSTDRTKLFIPNKFTPGPDYAEVISSGNAAVRKDWVDNSVKYDGKEVHFPNNSAISNGQAKNIWGDTVDVYYSFEGSEKFSAKERTWGFLNDLYVNFDFAKGILETKNFLIKDALYQILNGMSAAAGGLWDFQIQESPQPKNGNLELTVVEMNISSNNTKGEPLKLDLTGANSVFLEASFNMEMGGAIMNQVIGERNASNNKPKTINSSSPPVRGGLFSGTKKDLVGVAIQDEQNKGQQNWPAASDTGNKVESSGESGEAIEADEATKEAAEKKFAAFLEKVCLAPHVNLMPSDAAWGEDPYAKNYLCAYNDQSWFEAFKIGSEVGAEPGEVSILLPIKFSFTIHGVSGIKRGDKFVVNGLPQQYSTAGFFQVTAIKQVISGMLWKTEVEGGFRQNKSV